MKLFAINIGNTNTQSGMFEDGKFGELKSSLTQDLTADILPGDVPVAIASVVPEKSELLQGDEIFHLTPFTENELDTSMVDNSSLGSDRMANAIALANFAKLPAICMDCGTAITFEAVDANNVNFASVSVPSAGIEPNVIATASVLAQDQLSQPIHGNNGVYVIMVGIITDPDETTELATEKTRMTTLRETQANYEAFEALRQAANIEDNRAKFF